jgi:hypothetical protein
MERRKRRRRVQALGALEHVLPAGHRVDVVVVGQVVPHEPVPVASALIAATPKCKRDTHAPQQWKNENEHCTKRNLLDAQEYMRAIPLPLRASSRPITSAHAQHQLNHAERSTRKEKDSTERENAAAKRTDVPRR